MSNKLQFVDFAEVETASRIFENLLLVLCGLVSCGKDRILRRTVAEAHTN
jgi:hypothetical protein